MIKKELFPSFITENDFKDLENWIKNLEWLKSQEFSDLLDFYIDYNYPIEMVCCLSSGATSHTFEVVGGGRFSLDAPTSLEKRYNIIRHLMTKE